MLMQVGVIWRVVLYEHLSLCGVWLCVDIRMNAKKWLDNMLEKGVHYTT